MIPQGAEQINGAGKFIVPGLVNLFATTAGGAVTTLARTGVLGAKTTPEDARRMVHDWARSGMNAALLDSPSQAVEEAALDQGRKDSLPVWARVSTLADARRLVAGGCTAFIGMIRDTESMEAGFVARLRDLQTVWAPVLSELSGPELEVAKRNTRRLAEARVPIGVGSGTASVLRELELLQDAGLGPGDVLVAATRNGALALGRSRERVRFRRAGAPIW